MCVHGDPPTDVVFQAVGQACTSWLMRCHVVRCMWCDVDLFVCGPRGFACMPWSSIDQCHSVRAVSAWGCPCSECMGMPCRVYDRAGDAPHHSRQVHNRQAGRQAGRQAERGRCTLCVVLAARSCSSWVTGGGQVLFVRSRQWLDGWMDGQ